MGKEIEDGGQAYPVAWGDYEHGGDHIPGKTLRDYFAGQALPATITATSAGQHNALSGKPEGTNIYDAMAMDAFAMADAMIKARTPKEKV